MIVNFEQDPGAPFGTGNFRDESGKVMYLFDPDTAAQFVQTMPGSQGKLGKQVADESSFIAQKRMGDPGTTLRDEVSMQSDAIAAQRFGGQAPSRGPDRRLAENRPPEPEYYDPNAAGREVTASVIGSGPSPVADLVEGVAQVVPPPGGTPTPGVAPATAPAAGAAPAAPPAGAPLDPHTMVQNLSDVQGQLSARAQPRDIELPEPFDSAGLPLASVRQGDNVEVEEGRPIGNVLEQLKDEAPGVQKQIDLLRQTGKAKDEAAGRALDTQMGAQAAGYYAQGYQLAQARKDYSEAVREQQRLQAAIAQNDKALDPERTVRNMSMGEKFGTIILAALNGGFQSLAGQKNNVVLDELRRIIDADIDRQKFEIGNKRTSLNNLMQRYIAQGFDAKKAEALARDQLMASMIQYQGLAAQKIGASGQYQREAELLIAPIVQEWTKRRGDLLKEAEGKVKRTYQNSIEHAVPPPQVFTPQDALALLDLKNRQIQTANTADIEAAVGHPVSPDEGKQIRADAQDYGKRLATIAATRKQVDEVAQTLGMFKGPNGYTGKPDAGTIGSERRRKVENAYSLLKRMDVMSMAREPSANLQDEFGKLTSRPFWDSDSGWRLDALQKTLERAEQELRGGFSDEAISFYNRPRPPPAAPGAAPAAPAGPTAPTGRPGAPAPAAARPAARPAPAPAGNFPPGGDFRDE